ASNENAETM
nr:Chain E, NP366 peptide [synthetic construct]3CPL_F Chain F, NP366 peptide [synthetic construct]